MFRHSAFAIVLSALGFAASAQADQVRLRDDRPAEVVLTAPAKRVAAVSSFAADFLAAIGERPVALARTGDKILPVFLADAIKGLPDLGSRAAPNLERLSEIKPDLIVAIRRYTEKNAKRLEEIAPYLALDLADTADSLRAVTLVGRATGHESEAAGMNDRFAAMEKDLGAKAPGGVTAALLWGDGTAPWVYYDNYMTNELMADLKIRNAIGPNPKAGDKNHFADQASLEDLLLKDPDILFVFLPQDVAMETNPVWRRLKAVREGRAYAVGVQWMEVHGPIGREMVLREMAHLAYPQAFPKPDLPKGSEAVPFAKP